MDNSSGLIFYHITIHGNDTNTRKSSTCCCCPCRCFSCWKFREMVHIFKYYLTFWISIAAKIGAAQFIQLSKMQFGQVQYSNRWSCSSFYKTKCWPDIIIMKYSLAAEIPWPTDVVFNQSKWKLWSENGHYHKLWIISQSQFLSQLSWYDFFLFSTILCSSS